MDAMSVSTSNVQPVPSERPTMDTPHQTSGVRGVRRWMVVGGAGFLGYHLAHAFARRHIALTLMDIATFDASEYAAGVQCLYGDVRDAASLPALLEGSDVVIHAAAALPACRRREIMTINVQGTRNVLQACLDVGVSRVIYLSSSVVYGIPTTSPLKETDPLRGVDAYGESKIAAERVCEAFRTQGLCVPILRPSPFIGTGRMGVFQILYDWVLQGKRIPMIGDGTNRYQLLDVLDLVEAIERVAVAPSQAANETFNVGATEFRAVAEDLGALCEWAGTGARVLPTPAWLVKPTLALLLALRLSPLHAWMYGAADKDHIVSTEKLTTRLGWHSRVSNAQALIHSYQWYVQHHHELTRGSGVTHRRMWDQGILSIFKRCL